jgi:hypothetical protein
MIFILFLVTSCATKGPVAQQEFELSNKAFKQVEFTSHTGSGSFDNYLALSLSYPPFKDLESQVEKNLGFAIKDRGEAHITVISPVEYDRALKTRLSMSEINKAAQERNLQAASWRPVCVGKGSAIVNSRREYTYFVVLEAPELAMFRKGIQKLYMAKGGKESDFNPLAFYPHITLGFSAKDLHFEDGVVKDLRSCWGDIKIISEPQ